MAGIRLGAPAHLYIQTPAPIVTRTRRTIGSIPVACGELLTVQASRRARECTGV